MLTLNKIVHSLFTCFIANVKQTKMKNSEWMQVFPTRSSFIIFNLYIILFVSQALLVKGSQSDGNSYSYSTVTVVLLTELLKLVISALLYIYNQQSIGTLWTEIQSNVRLLALYLVPAALYCLYNNLAFHNLAAFDPTTYYLLLQFRVVVTALVYQVVFRRRLSGRQWLALIILTLGCVLKQLDVSGENNTNKVEAADSYYNSATIGALLLVLVQTMCSCVAGVYNEHLLKGRGHGVHILVQNVFMYLDSILCNALVLLFWPNANTTINVDLLRTILEKPIVLLIICNSAAVGIVTSFFLMTLDSILKVFASGLDLVLTAVMCFILFGIAIHIVTVLSIGLVLVAVWLYSTNPLPKQKHATDSNTGADDNESLLPPPIFSSANK